MKRNRGQLLRNLQWVVILTSATSVAGLIACIVCGQEGGTAETQAVYRGVTAKMSLVADGEVRVDKPIVVRQTIRNDSDQIVTVRVGPLLYANEITILTEDGGAASLTRFGRELKAAMERRMDIVSSRLEPGEKREAMFQLGRLFDMTTTGEYRVTIATKLRGPDNKPYQVTSEPLTIKVVDAPE